MHVCNYCKRVLKDDYEKCPGCGGSDFSNKSYLGEVVIDTPPKDGYKLNIDNYKRSIRNANIAIIIGIIVLIGLMIMFFPFIITPSILGIIIIAIASKSKKDTKRNLERVKKLANKGLLVKGLDYQLVNTGTMIAGKYYKCIQVNFKNSAGVEIPLYSETKFDVENKKFKTVDLLIDPDDYSNFFIDYEIY